MEQKVSGRLALLVSVFTWTHAGWNICLQRANIFIYCTFCFSSGHRRSYQRHGKERRRRQTSPEPEAICRYPCCTCNCHSGVLWVALLTHDHLNPLNQVVFEGGLLIKNVSFPLFAASGREFRQRAEWPASPPRLPGDSDPRQPHVFDSAAARPPSCSLSGNHSGSATAYAGQITGKTRNPPLKPETPF